MTQAPTLSDRSFKFPRIIDQVDDPLKLEISLVAVCDHIRVSVRMPVCAKPVSVRLLV